MKFSRLFGFVLASCVAVAGMSMSAQGQAPGGQAPQNLQVLPKEMTRQQVSALMRTFTAGLGVECSHCHTGGQADRAKDDNPKKAVARKMIKMMMAINSDFVKDVGEPAPAGQNKVTCYTCHRGSLKPLTAPPPGGGY